MKQISFYVNTSLKYIITFIIDKQSFSVSGAIFFEKSLCKVLHERKKSVPLHPQSKMIRLRNKKSSLKDFR